MASISKRSPHNFLISLIFAMIFDLTTQIRHMSYPTKKQPEQKSKAKNQTKKYKQHPNINVRRLSNSNFNKDSRDLLATENDQFEEPEYLNDVGMKLMNDINKLLDDVLPLRQRLHIFMKMEEKAQKLPPEAVTLDVIDIQPQNNIDVSDRVNMLNRELSDLENQYRQMRRYYSDKTLLQLQADITDLQEKIANRNLIINDYNEIINNRTNEQNKILNSEIKYKSDENDEKIKELQYVLDELKKDEVRLSNYHHELVTFGMVDLELQKQYNTVKRQYKSIKYIRDQKQVEINKLNKRFEAIKMSILGILNSRKENVKMAKRNAKMSKKFSKQLKILNNDYEKSSSDDDIFIEGIDDNPIMETDFSAKKRYHHHHRRIKKHHRDEQSIPEIKLRQPPQQAQPSSRPHRRRHRSKSHRENHQNAVSNYMNSKQSSPVSDSYNTVSILKTPESSNNSNSASRTSIPKKVSFRLSPDNTNFSTSGYEEMESEPHSYSKDFNTNEIQFGANDHDDLLEDQVISIQNKSQQMIRHISYRKEEKKLSIVHQQVKQIENVEMNSSNENQKVHIEKEQKSDQEILMAHQENIENKNLQKEQLNNEEKALISEQSEPIIPLEKEDQKSNGAISINEKTMNQSAVKIPEKEEVQNTLQQLKTEANQNTLQNPEKTETQNTVQQPQKEANQNNIQNPEQDANQNMPQEPETEKNQNNVQNQELEKTQNTVQQSEKEIIQNTQHNKEPELTLEQNISPTNNQTIEENGKASNVDNEKDNKTELSQPKLNDGNSNDFKQETQQEVTDENNPQIDDTFSDQQDNTYFQAFALNSPSQELNPDDVFAQPITV